MDTAVNQVCIAGRLTFRMCVTRSYRNAEGEWEDEASFFNVVARGETAEYGAGHLRKKTAVFVTGRLRSDSWRDDDDNPHSIVEIEARALQVLEK